jgi:hypothetical protein
MSWHILYPVYWMCQGIELLKKTGIFLFVFVSLSLFSLEFTNENSVSTRFIISTGISYNLKVSTNYYYQQDLLPLSIPLKFGFDTRLTDWFSLYTGIDFVYQIRSFSNAIGSQQITFYNNNFIIDLPLIFKFYPLAQKFDIYENFYVGLGVFPHFWVVNNVYYEYDEKTHIENAYSTDDKYLPPKKIYTPVNAGFYLSIGNHFLITDKVLFGIELFSDYLFVPVLNGYYTDPQVKSNNGMTQMDFYIKFGFSMSFAFDLSRR